VADLELASHKTEAVLISSRKTVESAHIQIEGSSIVSQRAIRYLSYGEHLEYVNKKASETTGSLCRILLKTRGPKQDRWKLLATVVKSQLLNDAPVCVETTAVSSYMRGVNSPYRLCAVRISSAFRTISDDAAFVIAGQVPLCELVRDAKEIGAAL